MAEKDKTGKDLERRVADAYRQIGATKVEHDVSMAGNQIDIYVELPTPAGHIHRVAIEAKDWTSSVGVTIVNSFAAISKLLRDGKLIDESAIVSPQGFTKPARDAADAHGVTLLEIADLNAMVAKAAKRSGSLDDANTKPLKPYFAHPYPLQKHFTGRISERTMLTEWLVRGNHPVLALTAIGGMGKSSLAWVWVQHDLLGLPLPGMPDESEEIRSAMRVPEPHRPEGVFWWSFYNREAGFLTFLDHALTYIDGRAHDHEDMQSTYARVRRLTKLLAQRRVLLVLDGFERELRGYASLSSMHPEGIVSEDNDGDFLACTDPHAGEFLCQMASIPLASRILLTSRNAPRELQDMAGCCAENLTGMETDDAVTFFRAQGVHGERKDMEDACRPYGYHPLSLRLLAGLIANDKRSPGDIRVANEYPVIPELKGKEQHHILQVAYDTLDKQKRTLLSRISAFRGPMPYGALSVFSIYAHQRKFDQALDELIDRGLLLFDRDNGRYDLHPVVRQYAYERLTERRSVHALICTYVATLLTSTSQVRTMDDLRHTIELYHHTVKAGKQEDALNLFAGLLSQPLFVRFAAYHVGIELLSALITDEDGMPTTYTRQRQAWVLNSLANAYLACGQPRRAISLFVSAAKTNSDDNDDYNLAVDLGNLASAQLSLGELAAAESNLRKRVDIHHGMQSVMPEGIARDELGRLLACLGRYDEAEQESAYALTVFTDEAEFACQGVAWAYRANCALFRSHPHEALDCARRAVALLDKVEKSRHPIERDRIQAEWLLGAALTMMASKDQAGNKELLDEAEQHLSESLIRARAIRFAYFESDILLAFARWFSITDNAVQATAYAREALAIADRCQYRLKQADIHSFLAELETDEGNQDKAVEHAQIAYERAWCDGPPHCYRPALDQAAKLLKKLKAEPPDMGGPS